jgi:hypothetical protein
MASSECRRRATAAAWGGVAWNAAAQWSAARSASVQVGRMAR